MAVEAPADIAILGLNPIALETGLYARFLGYHVSLLGKAISADSARINKTGSFGSQATSLLGRRALEAQGLLLDLQSIFDSESLVNGYLQPLAQTDLLSESVISNCQRIKIRLEESELPNNPEEDVQYDTRVFSLNLQTGSDLQDIAADILIDCRCLKEKNDFHVDFEFDLPPVPSRGSPTVPMTAIDDFYFLGEAGVPDQSLPEIHEFRDEISNLFQLVCDNQNLDLYKT